MNAQKFSPALRPAAVTIAAALHALLLMGLALPAAPLSSPSDNIEITIAQAGDAAAEATEAPSTETIAQSEARPDAAPDAKPEQKVEDKPEPEPQDKPDAKPDETLKDPPKDEPPPEPEKPEPEKPEPKKPQQVEAPPPKIEAPDAEAIARREARREEIRRRKKLERLKAERAQAQAARQARAGVAQGAHSGGSTASFGAKMLAEIRRHQIHAASTGSVRVGFSVGGGGAVSGAWVVSSSGDGAVDATALRIVRSCHPGPPPGGAFSGSATINFN